MCVHYLGGKVRYINTFTLAYLHIHNYVAYFVIHIFGSEF